ncbi:DNA polymerase ligase domain-containing protein [Trichoderma novae-zelandiae]
MEQPRKRPPSPDLIPNPLIKKRNLDWSLDSPASHPPPSRPTSPPPASKTTALASNAAQIGSGAAQISDHLARFSSSLSSHLRPTSAAVPRLSMARCSHLYQSCVGSPGGAHFVVHQHDHPVAGTHYDLRLQINESSSVSWAIMYGLPGDANSSRLSRNATETRIHCLWNHLVETASSDTGSLLIWDTGTYSVLPRPSKHAPPDDSSSPPAASPPSPPPPRQQSPPPQATAQSLLHAAFQTRKIRLRLHGAKLPDPYVINLRLTKSEDAAGRSRGLRTRAVGTRRRRGRTARVRPREPETSSDSSNDDDTSEKHDDGLDVIEGENKQEPIRHEANHAAPSVSEEHLRQQDAQVRLNNAYHGASNTIGSVYQRRWYLSLDRRASGFTEKRRHGGRSLWEPPSPPPPPPPAAAPSSTPPTTDDGPSPGPEPGSCRLSYPFYVRGPQFERSVVTGRLAEDILRDEGVTGFVPRKGWMPVLK